MKLYNENANNYSQNNNQTQDISNRYDKEFLKKIGGLYNQLTGENLNKSKLFNSIDIINKIRQNQEKTYLKSLLFPEKIRGSRIPTKFPTPSIAFSSTDTILITTNASGNFQLQWTPQVLLTSVPTQASANSDGAEIFICNDSTLTGFNIIPEASRALYTVSNCLSNSYFTCLQAFRLVSACCIVQYVGSFQDTRGILGGAVDVQPGAPIANLNYSSFTNVDDKLYSQRVNPENGLKVNFFPVDSNDTTFLQINKRSHENYQPTHITLQVYGQGLPASTQCIRVDFVKNCEAIPGPTGQDLLNTGYEIDYSESGDAFLKASKIMATNFLSTSSIDESKQMEQILNLPNNSYKEVLETANLEPKQPKLEKLQAAQKTFKKTPGFIPTEMILSNPTEINTMN